MARALDEAPDRGHEFRDRLAMANINGDHDSDKAHQQPHAAGEEADPIHDSAHA